MYNSCMDIDSCRIVSYATIFSKLLLLTLSLSLLMYQVQAVTSVGGGTFSLLVTVALIKPRPLCLCHSSTYPAPLTGVTAPSSRHPVYSSTDDSGNSLRDAQGVIVGFGLAVAVLFILLLLLGTSFIVFILHIR